MFISNWLKIQATILKNCFKKNKRNFLFKDLLHGLIIFSGVVLLYIFLRSMLNFISSRNLPAFDFVFILFSFSLLVLLPLIFYSAIICSLSFLFQKEEICFYFSLPISRVSVFSVKFLQVYFHAVWMVFLGLFAFLAAVQSHFKLSWMIYITGGASFLVFLLIPVCLAVILVLIISRFIPFVRARGILTVIGLLTASLIVTAIRLMRPERLITPEGKMLLVTFVQYLHKPWMTILPSEWLTNILFSQSKNDYSGVAVNFLSLFLMAAALFIPLYFLAKCFYAKAWGDASLLSASSKQYAWQAVMTRFSASVRGFIQKDLLTLNRDTVEKGSLLILIPLAFVYLYSMHILDIQVKNTNIGGILPFMYLYLFNFFYSSVVISGLSGRWVFPSVSVEGNNFKLIKGSPASLKDFLMAKFLLGFIPLLLLGQILILGSSIILHLQFIYVLVSGATMFLLSWGITMICLILGMSEADFSIRGPLDFALSYKGFLCFAWEFGFTAVVIVLVGIPTALFLRKGFSAECFLSLGVSIILVFAIINALKNIYKSNLNELSKKEV